MFNKDGLKKKPNHVFVIYKTNITNEINKQIPPPPPPKKKCSPRDVALGRSRRLAPTPEAVAP